MQAAGFQRAITMDQSDFADVARLVEAYPKLREGVPAGILDRLFGSQD
jgi:hypothetical protein